MKKTLTLLSIGLALGTASQGATVSSNQTDVDLAGFTSFNFTLNNVDWLTSTEVLTPEVLLDSLDITTAATWYRGNPMGLAIYQSDSPNQWNYVGKSEWNGDTISSGNRFYRQYGTHRFLPWRNFVISPLLQTLKNFLSS